LYPTQQSLTEVAATEDTPVAIIFNGPAQALDTMGGQIAFQVGATTLVVVGLMTLLLMSRWTRGEEESGRMELIRSLPVGEHAPMAAALIMIAAVNVVLGALVTATMLALDLPVAGSVAFGVSFVAIGFVFAGITAVTTQVSENNRVASGIAGAFLGGAFILRAVGDIGNGAISWLSPIGWSQKVRPWASEAWWALLVPVTATIVLAAVAARLASRRDFGAGLVAPKPGPATATVRLGNPVGLVIRLERGALFWWSVAVAVMGVAYGSLTDMIDEFVKDNESMKDIIARSGGGSLSNAFLGTSMLILALIASGFVVQSLLRPRAEEAALRAEALLATRLSRTRWLGSHVMVAATASAVVLTVGALATGIAAGAATGNMAYIPRLLGAGIAYLPAMWVIVGLGTALYAFTPRAANAMWGLLAVCFVVGFFKQLLDLPTWLADLSPFEHTPRMPAVGFDVVPLLVLLAVAATLVAAALGGFRRRDLTAN
jgi:ABC-2 type transport system permease protein